VTSKSTSSPSVVSKSSSVTSVTCQISLTSARIKGTPIQFLSQSDNFLLSYQETQYGQQFWNSDTRNMKLRVGPLNSYKHQ
jgi:hypothetical protein